MADIALFKETGIQITLLLTLMVIIAGLIVVVLKFLSIYGKILKRKESAEVKKEIEHLSPEEIAAYEQREKQLNFTPLKMTCRGLYLLQIPKELFRI